MLAFMTISALLISAQGALAGQIFDVIVGGPGILKFDPPFVNAKVGDAVRFEFRQKNHTATQSTFAKPCVPVPGGFDTSFVPVSDDEDVFPVGFLNVTTLNPVWVFCRQATHCQQGMVFGLNPGDKFAAFQASAASNPFGTASVAPPLAAPAPTATSAPAITVPANTVTTPTFSTGAIASASATTAASMDYKVIVGGPNMLTYSPSNITAAVGDTITFEFHQKNHTVTASSFNTPCSELALTSTTGQIGFDSGFMPVADGLTTGFPTFTITVNDTTPIWAYCKQGNHCGQGMVFSVNAVESSIKNFAAFQDLAKQTLNATTTPNTAGSSALGVRSFSRVSYAGIAFGALMLFL